MNHIGKKIMSVSGLFLGLIASASSYAINDGELTLAVLDQQGRSEVAAASVTIFDQDANPVVTMVTDEDGVAIVQLQPGLYSAALSENVKDAKQNAVVANFEITQGRKTLETLHAVNSPADQLSML